MTRKQALVCFLILLGAATSRAGENGGPTAGAYAASLGAGAALGLEPSAWGGTPAALIPGSLGFLLHAHHPFGMEELGVGEVGAHGYARRFGGGFSFRQLRVTDLYMERSVEIRIAARLLPSGTWAGTLDAGLSLSADRVDLAGREGAFGGGQGLGLIWRPLPRLAAGLMARGMPLGRGMDRDWEDQGLLWQAGLEARSGGRESGGPVQVLRFDLRKTGASAFRSLASYGVSPHPAVEATAALSSAPFRFSLGLKAAWGGFAFHQAWRHHRWLGGEALPSLGYTRPPGD